MRRGVRAAIKKLASGAKGEQEAAGLLQTLEERNAPIEEYLALLERLHQSSILPECVWLCLTTDLVEETADRAAEEAIGTWEEFNDHYTDSESALSDRLEAVIREFLNQTPMPMSYVLGAIENVTENIKDRCLDQSKIVEPYYDQFGAKVIKLMPQQLREAGCHRLAKLYEGDPKVFQNMKQDGEKWLIGMTYKEADQEAFRRLCSDSQS